MIDWEILPSGSAVAVANSEPSNWMETDSPGMKERPETWTDWVGGPTVGDRRSAGLAEAGTAADTDHRGPEHHRCPGAARPAQLASHRRSSYPVGAYAVRPPAVGATNSMF